MREGARHGGQSKKRKQTEKPKPDAKKIDIRQTSAVETEVTSLSRRRQKITALASLLPKLVKPALAKRGFALHELVTDWAAIAGPFLADISAPEKLIRDRVDNGAVLVVRVSPAAALQMQHEEAEILERINVFFGFRAVLRLRLRQAPMPVAPMRKKPPPPLSPEDRAAVAATVAVIADEGLRERLARLGEAIRRSRRK